MSGCSLSVFSVKREHGRYEGGAWRKQGRAQGEDYYYSVLRLAGPCIEARALKSSVEAQAAGG